MDVDTALVLKRGYCRQQVGVGVGGGPYAFSLVEAGNVLKTSTDVQQSDLDRNSCVWKKYR